MQLHGELRSVNAPHLPVSSRGADVAATVGKLVIVVGVAVTVVVVGAKQWHLVVGASA